MSKGNAVTVCVETVHDDLIGAHGAAAELQRNLVSLSKLQCDVASVVPVTDPIMKYTTVQKFGVT